MTTVREVYHALDLWAPFHTAASFDNCGLLVGDFDQKITCVGVALDITFSVIQEAIEAGVGLIVTHHPVIFHPMTQVRSSHVVFDLIQNNIATIAVHTNLDIAQGGTNTVLEEYYNLTQVTIPENMDGFGRLGLLDPMQRVGDYATNIKKAVGAQMIRYIDAGKPCERVAFVSGSGGSFLPQVLDCGADTFITGDMKWDQIVMAVNHRLNLIEVGHFDAEVLVLPPLAKRLAKQCGIPAVVLGGTNPIQVVG